MLVLSVSTKYMDEIVSLCPCILNEGIILVPFDCEDDLKDYGIPYKVVTVQ